MRTLNKGSVVLGNPLNCITYRNRSGCHRQQTKLQSCLSIILPHGHYHALALSVQGPYPSSRKGLLPPASDIWWPSLETCSYQDTPPIGADIWWLLKHVQSAQTGSTHPPGMLSCSFNVSCKFPNKSEPSELLTITQIDNIDSEDEQAKQ